jgi:hypothetical protein
MASTISRKWAEGVGSKQRLKGYQEHLNKVLQSKGCYSSGENGLLISMSEDLL